MRTRLRHPFKKPIGLLLCLALSVFHACAASDAGTEATKEQDLSVLLVGNSLLYYNDAPRILRAILDGNDVHPARIDMIAAPGASSIDHVVSGRVADALLEHARTHVFIQEKGGLLLCMDSARTANSFSCRKIAEAERELARAAQQTGAHVFLVGTYQDLPEAQRALARGERVLASKLGASGVLPWGDALGLLRSRYPAGKWMAQDGAHPGSDASVLVAVLMYQAMVGAWPDMERVRLAACATDAVAGMSTPDVSEQSDHPCGNIDGPRWNEMIGTVRDALRTR